MQRDDFSKSFRRGESWRNERSLFSLSLSLAEEAERNRDRPKPNTPAIRRDVNL